MRIAILHQAITTPNAPDENDVIIQAEAVGAALNALGHSWACFHCSLNLNLVRTWVEDYQPDVIFNLVESLEGTGRLIHWVPALMDAMGVAYTGACAEAILVTSHKVMAKDRMVTLGLPTPAWVGPFPSDLPSAPTRVQASPEPSARWIVKSVWEHASIGLDEKTVVLVNRADLAGDVLQRRARQFGGACFAETFIDGREFNLALLAGPTGPEVLAPAEIVFEGYPSDALKIVGYRAKWNESSYEYQHTVRRFDFLPQDSGVLKRLEELAVQCWQGFGLRGYARVDFRVDDAGQPWILEINTNPCLSPDAGFAAALQASGIPFSAAIARILSDTRPTSAS
jgi:D-alanine-D-alanine ligase